MPEEEGEETGQKELKCFAFQLTISTKTDVSEELIAYIKRFLMANCVFYHCVLERGKNDKLHLHAMLLFALPKRTRSIRNNLWNRGVKVHQGDDGTRGDVGIKVQVAPGDLWYKEYLRKEVGVIVVCTKWGTDDVVASYFPSAEDQQFLMEKAAKGKGSVDGWVARNLADYTAEYPVGSRTPQNAYKFVLQWYHKHRRDPDTRILKQRTEYLFRFAVEWFDTTEPWVTRLLNRHTKFLEKNRIYARSPRPPVEDGVQEEVVQEEE